MRVHPASGNNLLLQTHSGIQKSSYKVLNKVIENNEKKYIANTLIFWQSGLKKKQNANRGDKHNFRKTAVLKKNMTCQLKLQNKGLY